MYIFKLSTEELLSNYTISSYDSVKETGLVNQAPRPEKDTLQCTLLVKIFLLTLLFVFFKDTSF